MRDELLDLLAVEKRGFTVLVQDSGSSAVPSHGIGRVHLDALLALRGEQGARALLQAFPVTEVMVDDPGILRDIDTPADL